MRLHVLDNEFDVAESNTACSHKQYKASFYNYFVKYDDGYIGFNFLYRSIIRIPEEAFPEINKFIASLSPINTVETSTSGVVHLPSQWIEALKESHNIINTDFDELNFIKFHYFRSLYSSNTLSLIILPTLWCNLDCPYCFEYKKPIFMCKQIEDALIKWIEANFRYKRYVHINWFGGEPLLRKNIIFRLTKRIQEFCKDIGATYNSSITTNGFYLDENFQSEISSLGIRNIQVTLDGDKEEHDKLRKQRNGKGSFDRIFENIVSFCNNVKDCKLVLRINCGDSNYESIEKLIERFPPSVKSHVTIFFRWLWANEASDYKDFSRLQRGIEPFKGLAKLYEGISDLGWKTINPHNYLRGGYCEVDHRDHYIIDPEGKIYLCTHTFDGLDSIGSVFGGKDFIKPDAVSKYVSWYSVNPFEDNECIKCKILPICKGGCRKSRFEGLRGCIEEKVTKDLFVKNLVNEQLKVQIKN